MRTQLIFYFLFIFTISYGQESISKCGGEYPANVQIEDKLNGLPYKNLLADYNDQYFNEQFVNGNIVLRDGSMVRNKLLKYSGYLDELIWVRSNDYQRILLKKEDINEFSLFANDSLHTVRFKKIRIKNWFEQDSINAFLQVLVEGRYSLYAFRKMNIHSNSFNFYKQYEYFIKKPDGKLYSLKLRRKQLFMIVPEIKDDIKALIRNHSFKV